MKRALIALLLLCIPTFALSQVSPSIVDISLAPGDSVEVALDVSTASAPLVLDVVFVIDDTGSMGNEIAAIKAGASTFMTDIQAVADAQFGVVSFDDPAADTVLHHNLSDDVASVQAALNPIVASGGGDCPEFAISGISTAADQMTWRANSERIIFLVTDAGVKDANIPANNLIDTLATLDAEGITVNTLAYRSGCNFGDPTYDELADETGGVVESGLLSTDDPLTFMLDILALNLSTTTVIPTPQSCAPLTITTAPAESTVDSGDTASFDQTILAPAGPFTTVSCTVEMLNQNGLVIGTQSVTVEPADNLPPEILSISASPDSLWPPNGKMRDVAISVEATDNSGADPSCSVVSVGSDGGGSGDSEITGPLSLKLRAKRAGKGSGRTYTASVECVDAAGNAATASVDVVVPHDQRR